MAIEIELTGAERIIASLRKIAAATAGPRPGLSVVATSVRNNLKAGFRAGTAPDGARWAPLRHRRGQPLRDTGRLANSFVQEVSSDEAVVGTNVCYAIVHQFGATVEAGTAPHKTLCGQMTKGSPFLAWQDDGGTWHRAKKVTIPKRPFMPEGGLPERWAADALDALARAVGGSL